MDDNKNNQQSSTGGEKDKTAEVRSDRDGGKAIGFGHGQDTGEQGAAATAGGREGKFSLEDSEDEEGLDTDWSPGSDQPRS